MNKTLLSLLLSFTTFNAISQDSSAIARDTIWKVGGLGSLTFNQVSLTNWAAGGQSSLSLSGLISLSAKYKEKKTSWDSNLDLAFGFLKGEQSTLQKNDDRLEFNTNFGHQAKGNFFYSANLNFRTQFANGFNLPNDSVVTSRIMAPGYLTLALGLNYKKGDIFTFFLSPASGKFTFVLDQTLANSGAFGVKAAEFDPSGKLLNPGRQIRAELGASLTAKLQLEIMKNVTLKTNLQLFNNYSDKIAANRGNIDINWDVLLSMKINKFLTTSLMTNLIYDHDINLPTYKKINGIKTEVGSGPKTQFKEVFGIGISYRFQEIKKK